MKILGITGRMGAGKDFLFSKLARTFPGTAYRMAFADGVKLDIEETLLDAVVYTEDEYPTYEWIKPYKPEIRRLLQWWGTELRRGEDPDYWVKHAAKRLQAANLDEIASMFSRRETLVVFTDVRFGNEAAWIHEQGGKIAYVFAGKETRSRRLGIPVSEVEMLATHPSEANIDFITEDWVVNNDADDDRAALDLERFVNEWLMEG